MELAPPAVAGPSPEEIEALSTLVFTQRSDLSALRSDLLAIEQRQAEQVASFSQKLAQVEQHFPTEIEARVNARMAELESKLRVEFEDIHARTVDAFARTIETRVVDRIARLEQNLMSQSQAIVSLRERSNQTDEHLQKLLGAVERLCERAELQSKIQILPESPGRHSAAPVLPEDPALPDTNFASMYQRELDRTSLPEPKPELVYAVASAGSASPRATRRGGGSFALSLLGIAAFVGSRLIR